MAGQSARLERIAGLLDGCLIALDFDGTLAPFTNDPARSAPAPGAVRTLEALARAGARIAIVTGRDAVTAVKLSGLAGVRGLIVSGLHGGQLYENNELRSRDEPAGVAALRASLPTVLQDVDDAAWLEDKQLSLVVHTRRSADPERALEKLRPLVSKIAAGAGLEVHPGHLVLEIRMPGVSKGDALAELLRPDTTAALFAGDDYGDLPAVVAVRDWAGRTRRPALTIAVGPLAELQQATDLAVAGPDELVSLLGQLLPGPT